MELSRSKQRKPKKKLKLLQMESRNVVELTNENCLIQIQEMLKDIKVRTCDKWLNDFWPVFGNESEDEVMGDVIPFLCREALSDSQSWKCHRGIYARFIMKISIALPELNTQIREQVDWQCEIEFQKYCIRLSIEELNCPEQQQFGPKSGTSFPNVSRRNSFNSNRLDPKILNTGFLPFIISLFNCKILSFRFMVTFIDGLLDEQSDESCECLSILLKPIWKKFNKQLRQSQRRNTNADSDPNMLFTPSEDYLHQIFSKIYNLSIDLSLSAKNRSSMLELLDLRESSYSTIIKPPAPLSSNLKTSAPLLARRSSCTPLLPNGKTMTSVPLFLNEIPAVSTLPVPNINTQKQQKLPKLEETKAIAILCDIRPDNVFECADRFVELYSVFNPGNKETENAFASTIGRLILAKSLLEPNLSESYAQLVNMLANSGKLKPEKYFLHCLLNNVQLKFEINFKDDDDSELQILEFEHENSAIEVKSSNLLELERRRFFKRKRNCAIVTFIGHLYNCHLLPAKVIIDCMNLLADFLTDEFQASLCTLLTVAGRTFEFELTDLKNRNNAQSYAPPPNFINHAFSAISKFSRSCNCSAEVRLEVINLMELREKGWTPVLRVSRPKSIETGINILGQAGATLKKDNFAKGYFSMSIENTVKINTSKSTETFALVKKKTTEPLSSLPLMPKEASAWDINNYLKQTVNIMNKITSENCEKYAQQFYELFVDDDISENRIKSVVSCIFSRALKDTTHSILFVEMMNLACKEPNQTWLHHHLTKYSQEVCKDEVQEYCNHVQNNQPNKCAVVASAFQNVNSLELELENQMHLLRQKRFGLTSFITHLFNKGFLEPICIIDCLNILLVHKFEDNYEFVCLLLTNIGQRLEFTVLDSKLTTEEDRSDSPFQFQDKFHQAFVPEKYMDQMFVELSGLMVTESKLSKRVRFALQNLVELRANDWKPRGTGIYQMPKPLPGEYWGYPHEPNKPQKSLRRPNFKSIRKGKEMEQFLISRTSLNPNKINEETYSRTSSSTTLSEADSSSCHFPSKKDQSAQHVDFTIFKTDSPKTQIEVAKNSKEKCPDFEKQEIVTVRPRVQEIDNSNTLTDKIDITTENSEDQEFAREIIVQFSGNSTPAASLVPTVQSPMKPYFNFRLSMLNHIPIDNLCKNLLTSSLDESVNPATANDKSIVTTTPNPIPTKSAPVNDLKVDSENSTEPAAGQQLSQRKKKKMLLLLSSQASISTATTSRKCDSNRKCYDRNFLLLMERCPLARIMPDSIPPECHRDSKYLQTIKGLDHVPVPKGQYKKSRGRMAAKVIAFS